MKKEAMEIDSGHKSNGSKVKKNETSLDLTPVAADGKGEGLPYAPINWPNPGDNWRWKVGKRFSLQGYYLDRYLYLPEHFRNKGKAIGGRYPFASKLSVERYIRATYPDADIESFFASFSWIIPSKQSENGNTQGRTLFVQSPGGIKENSASNSQLQSLGCKAGSKLCSSVIQAEIPPLTVMPCDICCSEPDFCRDCCCILCCKTIDSAYDGYSYIRCEAKVSESYICGHVAHVECALRCYMAGTVGGSIGLDAEYCCRRCDARTDLVAHATRIAGTCESIDSRDVIEKILNVAICILRGSEKLNAIRLLNSIESALIKLKCGTCVEDIWKIEDNMLPLHTEVSDHENATSLVANGQDQSPNGRTYPEKSEFLELELEIDQVLHALKISQKFEYEVAEETLFAQKSYLLNLYEQLNKEKLDLANNTSPGDRDTLLNAVLKRTDQIKCEVLTLKDMEKVAEGFGRTSKHILKKHFHFEIEK